MPLIQSVLDPLIIAAINDQGECAADWLSNMQITTRLCTCFFLFLQKFAFVGAFCAAFKKRIPNFLSTSHKSELSNRLARYSPTKIIR